MLIRFSGDASKETRKTPSTFHSPLESSREQAEMRYTMEIAYLHNLKVKNKLWNNSYLCKYLQANPESATSDVKYSTYGYLIIILF